MKSQIEKKNLLLVSTLVGIPSLLPLFLAAQNINRSILPVPEPQPPTITELDARNVKPPPRFEVKAPKEAPNVVAVLLDDIGFGQPSTFGGPCKMPTLDKLAADGLRTCKFALALTLALTTVPARIAFKNVRLLKIMKKRRHVASDDSRLSRPNTVKGRIQREALKALRRHERDGELPTSTRFLFYELEQAGVVSKVRTGARRADQDLTDAVKHLRDVGLVPWNWIVDETRRLHYFDGSDSIAADLVEFLDEAHIKPWRGKARPFILTESRTLGGVIARTIAPLYRFPVASTNGQAGGFLVTDIAPCLRDEEFRVLYVGDFDRQQVDCVEQTSLQSKQRENADLPRG